MSRRKSTPPRPKPVRRRGLIKNDGLVVLHEHLLGKHHPQGAGQHDFLHVAAGLITPAASLWDRFLYGAPLFAPMVFADLALLAALALWAVARMQRALTLEDMEVGRLSSPARPS